MSRFIKSSMNLGYWPGTPGPAPVRSEPRFYVLGSHARALRVTPRLPAVGGSRDQRSEGMPTANIAL